MRKLLFLLICIPLISFGYQTTFKVKPRESKIVYLDINHFMQVNKKVQVLPLTCYLSTTYAGKIHIITQANYVGKDNQFRREFDLSASKPDKEYISGDITDHDGMIGDPIFGIDNLQGCSVVQDGQKCRDAKDENLDSVNVTCTESDN